MKINVSKETTKLIEEVGNLGPEYCNALNEFGSFCAEKGTVVYHHLKKVKRKAFNKGFIWGALSGITAYKIAEHKDDIKDTVDNFKVNNEGGYDKF